MSYKNLTANLLRLSLPKYWQSHLPYGSAVIELSGVQFGMIHLKKLLNSDWLRAVQKV